MSRILSWDLETTGLEADWDSILCIGYKWVGESPKILSIKDYPGEYYDDSSIIEAFLPILDSADIEVTHYGTLFDIPFLKARMLKHHLGYFPSIAHVDTYFVAKSNLRISSKRLDRIARFLDCKTKKTVVDPEIWLDAKHGDLDAMEYIEKHCLADCKVLEEVYMKLRPMMKRHPVIGEWGNCHVCGKNHIIRKGYSTTLKGGKQIRIKCMDCGNEDKRRA